MNIFHRSLNVFMNRCIRIAMLSLALACGAFASTRGITFIYQPLTTLGTDQDTEIVVTKIPVLTNTVEENLITHIASPNRLLQDATADVPDSNLLSLLHIRIEAELVDRKHFKVTLDLRDMLPTDDYDVTPLQVVAGAVKALRATFDEHPGLGSYELHIRAKEGDKTDWSKHTGRYTSKKKKR
jgi:hypothetical protein